MKTSFSTTARRLLRLVFLVLALGIGITPSARAGLTVDIHLYHDSYGYYFYPWLSANATSPDFPDGNYMIASPQIPNGGSQLQYQASGGTLNFTGGSGNYYGDFDSFLFGITNGQWSITVTNLTSTNVYLFSVTVTGVTSNSFGAPVALVFPLNGVEGVTNQPLFQWTGPANWAGSLNVSDDYIDPSGNYNYEASTSLPPDQTAWPCPVVLPNGTNDFNVDYSSNVTAQIVASTPLENASQPISGWISTATLETSSDSRFTVGSLLSQANLVANGGFETGDFTDWTVAGDGNFVDDGSDSGITPSSGNYDAVFGAAGEIDTISQTLPTTPGASYLLSFWLNSPDGETPNEFQVMWDGTVLFDQTDLPALGWTNLQFVVTATGNTTVLQFGGQDDPSYLALDDVSVGPVGGPGHTLIAHYAFDNEGNLGQDSSGNGNDMSGETWWGPQHAFSPDAEAGGGAVQFFGTDAITANGQTLTNLNAVLAGSFTFSTWVKTTVTNGEDSNNAFFGAVIFWAYNDQGNTNDTIPLSITGSKAAFTTRGGDSGVSDNLHSITSVNDGNYHLITVTRDQSTGEKKIYVDGNFETSQTGTTNPLNGNNYNLTIGGWAYVLNSDSTVTNYSSYSGLLDDLQVYSGVLSDSEVASLYANPGTTIPNVSGTTADFAAVLGTTNLTWSTSGDSLWFVESTNTANGEPYAAQSGSVMNNQYSTLSATVTGPGTLTFYWASQDDCNNFDYEFDIDGDYQNDIYCSQDWVQAGSYTIPAGQHTLTWTTYAYGDTDPTQAGFLNQVTFTSTDTRPVSGNMSLDIYREQDPTFGEIYVAYPSFNSISPAGSGTTTNIIQSPNNYFSTHADQSGGGSSSAILYSLDSVLNECTNGLWSLYINYGLPDQRQFQFSVGINGLTTNGLPAVKFLAPTNGTSGFPSTAAIQWLGPSNYTSLNVSKQNIDGSGYLGTSLPVTATSWTPGLVAGTNRCDLNYVSNNFPNVTFSVPVDSADSETATSWSGQLNLNSTATAIFVVSANASRVTLLEPQISGGNFQFSFLSQAGYTNSIQYRTNLATGTWLTWTNLPGDGTTSTVPVPFSLFSPAKQGFIRVSTQ